MLPGQQSPSLLRLLLKELRREARGIMKSGNGGRSVGRGGMPWINANSGNSNGNGKANGGRFKNGGCG